MQIQFPWKVYTWGPIKCGLYKQVVFIYRWSLEQVGLYHKAHLAVYKTLLMKGNTLNVKSDTNIVYVNKTLWYAPN